MLNTHRPQMISACIISVLINICCGISLVRGQTTPANLLEDPKDNVEDLANVDFRTDIRMFVVMAALNAAGYTFESEDRDFSEARAYVMEKLSHLPPSTFTELQLQYKTTNLWAPETTHAAYTSLALLLEGPPDFAFKEQLLNVPHGIDVIRGFEMLLPDFYNNAELEKLWTEVQPSYQKELQLYRPMVLRVIRETLDYFRIPAKIYFDRNIVFIPDLLTYHDIVNARNVEDVYYIVVGPSEDPEGNYLKLQHEYLHFLLDPLIEEHSDTLKKSESFLGLAQKQPLFPKDLWNDYNRLITESLIESILFRIHPEENVTAEDSNLRKLRLVQRGMILCPWFERKLSSFEADTGEGVSLPLFLGRILSEIPAAEIEKDLDEVIVTQKGLEKQEEQLQEKIRLQEIELEKQKLLDDAGSLIAAGDMAGSSGKLNRLLEMDPGSGKAFFYLAQIAARQKNWRKSRELHRKTLSSQGLEPWIYAHSLVRIGRINAAEGLYSEARKNFEQVLSMEGDLRESREEAGFLLGNLPK